MTIPRTSCTLFLAVAAVAGRPSAAQLAPKAPPPPPTHHAVTHGLRCPVPIPQLSPKIPPVPGALGCPKVEYALTYLDLKAGTGAPVETRKWTTVQYTGYLTDGTKFDSSYDHGQPFTFALGARQVIPGWDTGFEGMRMGGKRRLFIPYQLAYGEMGRPPVIPPKSELIFDIEVVSQSDTPPEGPPIPRPEPPGAGVHPPPGMNPQSPAGQNQQPPEGMNLPKPGQNQQIPEGMNPQKPAKPESPPPTPQ